MSHENLQPISYESRQTSVPSLSALAAPTLAVTTATRTTPALPASLPSLTTQIPPATAIRILQSVRRNRLDEAGSSQNKLPASSSTASWVSINGNICRICRCKRSDTELLENLCGCSGTMGYVHLKCLQRWVRFRNSNICEICKETFNIPPDNKKYRQLFLAFFQQKYFGQILKHILNLISVTPLIYFTMNQFVAIMEQLNEDEPDNRLKVIIIGPTLLLTTSIYFFFYFEWALNCLYRIKNIFMHWWNFGDQIDEEYNLDLEEDNDINIDIFDLF